MPIPGAFMVPHPPMIIPEVGNGSEQQIETTIQRCCMVDIMKNSDPCIAYEKG